MAPHFNRKLFIYEIRKSPFLYDKEDKNFGDTSLKKARWRAIGQMFNLTGYDCMKKWKNLRDRYIKIKNALAKSNAQTGMHSAPKLTWPYFELMDEILQPQYEKCASRTARYLVKQEYLQDSEEEASHILLDTGESSGSVGSPTLVTHSIQEAQNCLDISFVEGAYASPQTSFTLVSVESSNPARADPSTSLSSVDSSRNSSMCDSEAVPSTPTVMPGSSTSEESKEDFVYYFIRGLECRLRNLNKRDQSKAMHDIENLLYTIEMTSN